MVALFVLSTTILERTAIVQAAYAGGPVHHSANFLRKVIKRSYAKEICNPLLVIK